MPSLPRAVKERALEKMIRPTPRTLIRRPASPTGQKKAAVVQKLAGILRIGAVAARCRHSLLPIFAQPARAVAAVSL